MQDIYDKLLQRVRPSRFGLVSGLSLCMKPAETHVLPHPLKVRCQQSDQSTDPLTGLRIEILVPIRAMPILYLQRHRPECFFIFHDAGQDVRVHHKLQRMNVRPNEYIPVATPLSIRRYSARI